MCIEQINKLDRAINSLIRQREQLDHSIQEMTAIKNTLLQGFGHTRATLQEIQSTAGFKRQGGLPPRQVVVGYTRFDSISACARHFGIDKKTVKDRCRSRQFSEWHLQSVS